MFQCFGSATSAASSEPVLHVVEPQREVALLADAADPSELQAARIALQGCLHELRRQAAGNWLEQDGDPAYLLQLVNRLLLARARRSGPLQCGLALCCADEETLLIAQLGGLRAWRHTAAKLTALGAGQLDVARDARLGRTDAPEPALYSEPRRAGQLYLLCSEALARELEVATLEGLLEDHGEDYAAAVAAITAAARLAGVDAPCSALLIRS